MSPRGGQKALWVALALLVVPLRAGAHGMTPSLLELHEREGGRVDVLWRTPQTDGKETGLSPRIPEGCTQVGKSTFSMDSMGDAERFQLSCTGGSLAGRTLAVAGLEMRADGEVLVRIEREDGESIIRALRPVSPSLVIPKDRTPLSTLKEYVALGIHHIVTGYDHLLFVLGLLLLVRTRGGLLGAISAFTVAHSITLSLATLGWVQFPTRVGEAVIALSIVFLAFELTRPAQTEPTLSRRRPWVVAFIFGLVHGFGFAGALAEVGLPSRDVPLALFGFNLGVELGQLGCVAVAVVVAAVARRLTPRQGARAPRGLAYVMGSFAFAWFIERVLVLMS